jgi:hypothetical protein
VPRDDRRRQRLGRISRRLYQRRHEKRAREGSASRASQDAAEQTHMLGFEPKYVSDRGQRVREERVNRSGRQRIATSTP